VALLAEALDAAGLVLVLGRPAGAVAVVFEASGERRGEVALADDPQGVTVRALLLGQPAAKGPLVPPLPEAEPWYAKWQVWAIAGAAVAAIAGGTALGVALSQSDRVTLVIGRGR